MISTKVWKSSFQLALFAGFFCGFFTGATAQAEEPERDLMRATSRSALMRISRDLTQAENDRKVCSLQMRSNRVPLSCFALLNREKDILPNATREQGWMTEICLQRVKSSNEFLELINAESSQVIPETCRQAARERLADLRYRAQNLAPDSLFRLRFQGR